MLFLVLVLVLCRAVLDQLALAADLFAYRWPRRALPIRTRRAADEHPRPSPTAVASPSGAFSENAMSQSTQLHISRPHLSGSTAAPSGPWRGKRIISKFSVQHGLGYPEGKIEEDIDGGDEERVGD